ncbi:hypothetical protein TNCV_2376361 [Trichonephila clavipes]|nr:hypothetical protein TNCV_2376361 [Trichonephila clavipes]
MFRPGVQCLVPKRAWYSFIDPLKGRKAESTLLCPILKPRTWGWKRDTQPFSHWASTSNTTRNKILDLLFQIKLFRIEYSEATRGFLVTDNVGT